MIVFLHYLVKCVYLYNYKTTKLEVTMLQVYIVLQFRLPQTSSANSTRCDKDTQSQSVKDKTTKQLADAQTSKRV